MSFLTRTTRIAATRAPVASRAFTASAVQNKTVVDTAKDTLKAVDRKVSDKLVDGIEIGEAVVGKTKEVTGAENLTGKAEGKAAELAGQAKGQASKLAGEAKGKAYEVEGAAKKREAEVKRGSGTGKPGVSGL